MNTIDVDNKLKLETQAQRDAASDTLRALRYLLQRLKMENRKNWSMAELTELIDTMLVEISTGVTEEDKERSVYLKKGETAFYQGVDRQQNPYQLHTLQRTCWDTGWHDAERNKRKPVATPLATPQKATACGTTPPQRLYKIQLKESSQILEWNDVFHQYAKQGGGSLYENYEDAVANAERLQKSANGMVSVVVVKPNAAVAQLNMIDMPLESKTE
ncbi:hypothetical protein [Beggiatoa leptomitoformis]|uniref:Uncharacterized protein n=1 Tax=Beggiatoa leptomitoformis TaxID=288004 RepID=A0A2N9YEY6_9GAMM|nr:hypothetical protein [Beggiatoa leptomitoformis]ALG68614.1 hypothetical protein AL038_14015 [Beggiatoa leptomitoformis]AUI69040.1 hypothetical protein BLE401_10240 [Beggiatoa leptomitoformis]